MQREKRIGIRPARSDGQGRLTEVGVRRSGIVQQPGVPEVSRVGGVFEMNHRAGANLAANSRECGVIANRLAVLEPQPEVILQTALHANRMQIAGGGFSGSQGKRSARSEEHTSE